MYIHSFSPFICDPIDDIEGLKADLKNYTDFFFRRVNKFILLSLLGVHKCIHGKMIDRNIAVYLTTENGNLGDTENVLHQMYDENSFPKPFNFINTMSNTASFYVAQSLKSLGRSITVSSKNVSFERGLELAAVDLERGHVREALVGGVDEAVISREHFMKKYDTFYHDTRFVEGSSWLYLTVEKNGSIGEITGIRTYQSREAAIQWIQDKTGTPSVIAFGILIPPVEKDIFKMGCKAETVLDYLGGYGYYDTAASFATGKFLESATGGTFAHINKNIHGSYVIFTCKKY